MANLDENSIKIGSLLQSVRESHGIRQSELCEVTGLSKNHISAVERGVLRLIDGVETALDEADKFAEEDGKRYTHEEVFSNLRRRING